MCDSHAQAAHYHILGLEVGAVIYKIYILMPAQFRKYFILPLLNYVCIK
jgi:hypothetical protein